MMKMKTWMRWFALTVVAALAICSLNSCRRSPARVSPQRFEQVLNDFCRRDLWVGGLAPDASGHTLAYLVGGETGLKAVLLDLKTLEKHEIPTATEIPYIAGWSADDRYLSYAQTVPPAPTATNSKSGTGWQMMIYDRQNDGTRRLTQASNVMEMLHYWLPNGDYLLVSRVLQGGHSEMFLGNPQKPGLEKVSASVRAFAVMSDALGVYSASNELWTLELKPLKKTASGWDEQSRTTHQISDFKSNGFNGLTWVRYSAITSNFLFCSTPAGSDLRHLFRYEPGGRGLTQISKEDTYNGRFLQGGAGYAFVVNSNSGFQLAVRPADPAYNTNLFTDGSLLTYKVSPDGGRIYAWASMGAEPRGLWEYGITNRTLRKVAYGTEGMGMHTEIVQPQEFKLKSFDDLEIPCFVYPPAEMARQAKTPQPGFLNGLRPATKYPVVIYIPPPSWQFQRGFNSQAQVFANLGFYFVAINYRGCDGYGAQYSKMADTRNAARDVLELRDRLLKNPQIDAGNMFLDTLSGGTPVVSELLATHTEFWRGVSLNTPGSIPIDSRFEPDKLPPIIIVMGTQDKSLASMQEFASWAVTNGVEVKSVVHTNSGHIAYNLGDRMDTQRQMIDFFLKHLK